MLLYNKEKWKTLYPYTMERICLYLLIELTFFMLFLKAIIKVISYFYGYNVEIESNTILGILLLFCYALNTFFPNIRTKIIDGILKIYFHRFFLIYTKYTENFITFLADKFSKLFLILISIYLPIVILYYLDVIYFQYDINMGLTIQLYFSLYLIRTLIFLPTYLFGIISNHPRSDELFIDFFSRNPNYLKMVMPVLGTEAGPAMRRLAEKVVEQTIIIMEKHPTAGPATGAAAFAASAAAAAAHHHADAQRKTIAVIEKEEKAFRLEMESQNPAIKYDPTTFASKLELSEAKVEATIKTLTGPAAVRDRLWASYKQQPNSVEKYQDAAFKAKQASIEVATKTASKNTLADSVKEDTTSGAINSLPGTANSVKEFSLQDLFAFFFTL